MRLFAPSNPSTPSSSSYPSRTASPIRPSTPDRPTRREPLPNSYNYAYAYPASPPCFDERERDAWRSRQVDREHSRARMESLWSDNGSWCSCQCCFSRGESPQTQYTPLSTPPLPPMLLPAAPATSETVTEFAFPTALKDEEEVCGRINEFMFGEQMFPFGINLSRQRQVVEGDEEVHTFFKMVTPHSWEGLFEAQVRQILADAVADDGVIITVRQLADEL